MSAASKVADGMDDVGEEEEKEEDEEEEEEGGVKGDVADFLGVFLFMLMLRLKASAAFEIASLICSMVFSLSKWKSISIHSPLS